MAGLLCEGYDGILYGQCAEGVFSKQLFPVCFGKDDAYATEIFAAIYDAYGIVCGEREHLLRVYGVVPEVDFYFQFS